MPVFEINLKQKGSFFLSCQTDNSKKKTENTSLTAERSSTCIFLPFISVYFHFQEILGNSVF